MTAFGTRQLVLAHLPEKDEPAQAHAARNSMFDRGREVDTKSTDGNGRAGRAVLLGLLLSVTLGQTSLAVYPAVAETQSKSSERKSNLISGTIEALDAATLEVKIRTDVGLPVVVKVLNPDLLRDLTVGDRVTAQLDAKGRVRKIMKLTIPELQEPTALPSTESGAGSRQAPTKETR
jgi:hypothetical protein